MSKQVTFEAKKISEAERLVSRASVLMDEAVERSARSIMARFPIAREYVQAMGVRYFVVVLKLKDGTEYELQDPLTPTWVDDDEEGEEVEPADRGQLEPLRDVLRTFQFDVVDRAEALFGASVTLMRFTATGDVVTDW